MLKTDLDDLGRQPDAEPPLHGATPPPSLLIYALLIMAALILIVVAQKSSTTCSNLSSFTMNLSTELIGAVIILILVDRRFRDNEVKAILGLPSAARRAILSVISSEVNEVTAYAGIVTTSINKVLPFYVSRPDIEHELESKSTTGVLLVGAAGIGKTTLLQRLVLCRAKEVVKDPSLAIVPVIVPSRAWTEGEVEDIIYGQMNMYYSTSRKTFNKLIKKDRLLCIFDGIDESINPTETINKIINFKNRTNVTHVVVSSRPGDSLTLLSNIGLKELRVPELAEETKTAIHKIRTELSDMLLFLTPEAIMRASEKFSEWKAKNN